MSWDYGFYSPKRKALRPTRDQKILAEDAVVQRHSSFIHLRDNWYDFGVLERAVHMHRLAASFKKVAIARNLQKDEGTVRRYAAVAKLSSYWKCEIDSGKSYDRVLKAAKSDPRPDIKPEAQVPAAPTASQPAKPIAQTAAAAPPPAAATQVSPLELSQPAAAPGPDLDKVPVQTITAMSRARERRIPNTAPNQHSQAKPHNGSDPKHCHECLKRERKRHRLEQKLEFYHPQSPARIPVERELVALCAGENCDEAVLDR